MPVAWPFFHFMVYGGKKKNKDVNKKKWFQLKHTIVNHPRYKFQDEYDNTRVWCEKQPMEDWYIISRDGLRLHASYLKADNPKRFIIMCHGYRGSRFGSVAHMAKFMHDENSSILLIDQRCCGESEGKYITFGAKEQYDVLGWVEKVKEVNVSDLPIYLYGQSMGATTVLLAGSKLTDNQIKGLISDCGFQSMKGQLKDIALGWFHLPWIGYLLFRVEILCRIFAGFSMSETDLSKEFVKNTNPVLLFHGTEDTYVWPENSVHIYSICKTQKEIVLVSSAKHLCSSFVNPDLYQKKLKSFFDSLENNK